MRTSMVRERSERSKDAQTSFIKRRRMVQIGGEQAREARPNRTSVRDRARDAQMRRQDVPLFAVWYLSGEWMPHPKGGAEQKMLALLARK